MQKFWDIFFNPLPWQWEIVFLLRIVLAGVLGFFIGLERMHRSKEAGVRTHIVLAVASAIFMLISKYGFSDLKGPVADLFAMHKGADSSRIAAQIVSGIGFIGAGIIFKNSRSISGLTTAAGMWATAGIGMAVGSGMYGVGLAGTLIIVGVQYFTHRLGISSGKGYHYTIVMEAGGSKAFREWLMNFLEADGLIVEELNIQRKKKGTAFFQLIITSEKALVVPYYANHLLDASEEIESVRLIEE